MAFEHILVVGGGWVKEGETRLEWRCVLSSLLLKMTHAALIGLVLNTRAAPLCLFIRSQCLLYVCFVCVYPYCLCVCVCLYFCASGYVSLSALICVLQTSVYIKDWRTVFLSVWSYDSSLFTLANITFQPLCECIAGSASLCVQLPVCLCRTCHIPPWA